ncbi:MAG: hypothetical protein ACQEP7_04100 [bacterium]
MSELERVNQAIGQFSLIGGDSDYSSWGNFQDVILHLAGLFRQADRAYILNFQPGDRPDYRLRSDKSFSGNKIRRKIDFSPRDATLKLAVEDLEVSRLEAIEQELRILIEKVNNEDSDPAIEPELNLLRRPAFMAELEVEFQRWERYEIPLLLVVYSIKTDDLTWQKAGKELKHLTGMIDIIGYISEQKIAAIFPGTPSKSDLAEKILKRLEKGTGGDSEVNIIHVPTDIEQWKKLKNRL